MCVGNFKLFGYTTLGIRILGKMFAAVDAVAVYVACEQFFKLYSTETNAEILIVTFRIENGTLRAIKIELIEQ